MRTIIFAIILVSLAVYASISGTYAGAVSHHAVSYEAPPMPLDPDDDENEDRVRSIQRKTGTWKL